MQTINGSSQKKVPCPVVVAQLPKPKVKVKPKVKLKVKPNLLPGALQVCQEVLNIAQKRRISSQLVTDELAVECCQLFLRDHQFLVEPACGATLSAVYSGKSAWQNCWSMGFDITVGCSNCRLSFTSRNQLSANHRL